MRRVNVATGLKQRMYDVLGEGDNGIITPWSIQSAMLSNFRRLCKALNEGSNVGKVLSGLNVSHSGDDVTITPGYGTTPGGDLISLTKAITQNIPSGGASARYLCLEYTLVPLHEDVDGYKETSIINESGLTEIVFDEHGAAKEDAITSDIVSLKSSLSEITSSTTLLYLCTLNYSGGSLDTISYDMTSAPMGRVTALQGTPQSINNETYTRIIFETVIEDINGEYNSGTGVYTAIKAGVRSVSWGVFSSVRSWADQKGMFAQLRKNDSMAVGDAFAVYSDYGASAGSNKSANGCATIYLNPGDTLSVYMYHSQGGTITTYGSPYANSTFFNIFQLDD